MSDWVALLRGVNVGGVTIRSADLGALFDDLGFTGVRTVLASGNVAFTAPEAAARRGALKARIEGALGERFGYDAWIVLVLHDELRAAVAAFPFDRDSDQRQPYAVFCVDEATRDELLGAAASLDAATDPIAPGEGVVYWTPAKAQTLRTPFAKVLARRTFAARTTTRNLRTLVKIVAARPAARGSADQS